MKEFKILMLSNIYPHSMGGYFVHNQVKSLIKAGCQVRVVVPVPYYPKKMRFNSKWNVYADIPEKDIIDSIPVYYPRYFRFPGRWFHGLSCFSQYFGIKTIVHEIIKEFKPCILHAHASTAIGYVGLILKKKYDLPLICTLRGSDINLYPFYGRMSMYLTKKLIKEADQLLSVSNALKMAANQIAKSPNEIRVVYNGCDLIVFNKNKNHAVEERNRFGIPINDMVLIFVGSVTRSKGIFELINAFIKLNNNNSKLHLMIIGGGSALSEIKEIIHANNIETRVHIFSNQPHDKISIFLNAADILVLPSYAEGLPNVILEAMACGLPVIASKVGGIPEAIEEGISGILVEKQDVDTLTKAIEKLIEDKHLSEQMGANGRKIVEEKFTWNRNAENLMRIYEEILRIKSSIGA